MREQRVAAATLFLVAGFFPLDAQERRAMDYPDLFRQASIGQTAVSPDGTRLLYTVTPGSFPEPRSAESHVHLAEVDGSGARPMTREGGVANTDPRWHPAGDLFAFVSDRGEEGRQLYVMRPDGGEATKVTEAEGGIHAWGWSPDGETLAFLAGEGLERQIWTLDGRGEGNPEQLTDHPTPIESFSWRSASAEILYVAPDDWDEADHERREEGFAARPIQRGLVFPDFLELHPAHLWRIDTGGSEPRRVTEGEFIVHGFEDSPRGDRVALVVGPVDPHADTRPNEIQLVDPETGRMERLTENDVSERILGFSPDGSLLAVVAPRWFEGRGISDIFVRPVSGGEWRAVTGSFDNDVFGGVWSEEGDRIFFVGAEGVNRQLFEADARDGEVRRFTDLTGVVSIHAEEPGSTAVLGFSDPYAPEDLYTVAWSSAGDRDRWTRVTRINPWVETVELARTEAVRWRSADGTEVEGLVVYPLDHDPSRPYPLITEIHGGPASAFTNSFLPTASNPHRAYGHLLAARGYALFLPNYRGSSHYGHEFQVEIAGDYWTRATEDILTGIDHLIETGLAHPDSLGLMGWSAGGHWSNWLLVRSDRFRAIASGAGVANWISLYGQTDNQASREWYLGLDGSLGAANKPWDDFEHWWAESPLRYIRNASTPTLIHFPQADQRIPMPQGQELHMALKSLGVPTEFLVYPREQHALREPRNQLVKLLGDLRWFEKWIRGEDGWLEWGYVLDVARRIEEDLDQPGLAVTDRDPR